MGKFYIRSYRSAVKLDIPERMKRGVQSKAPLWIPNAVFEVERETEDYTIGVSHDTEPHLDYDSRNATIRGPSKVLDEMDIVCFCARLMERLYQEHGAYSFHSSCLSDGNTGVLLSGEANVGKSTILVKACLDNSLRFVSGDRTLLKDDEIVGGTEKISLREGSVLFELPELREFVTVSQTDDCWETKIDAHYTDLGFMGVHYPVKIKAVVFPRKTKDRLRVGIMSSSELLVKLHEQISYFADLYPHIMYGLGLPIPQFIDFDDKKRRAEYTKSLADRTPCYSVSGSLEDIASWLMDIF